MLKRKGLYVVFGAVAALAVLLGSVGAAYAQGNQPPVGDRPFYPDCPAYGGALGSGSRMYAGRGLGMHGFSLVDATAEVTGLSVDEVTAALEEGQTFAQIAEAQGVDPQAIVEAFLVDRKAALDEAVAEGRLSQDQADEMLEEMTDHLTDRLSQPWTPRSYEGHTGRGGRMGSRMGFAPRFSSGR